MLWSARAEVVKITKRATRAGIILITISRVKTLLDSFVLMAVLLLTECVT